MTPSLKFAGRDDFLRTLRTRVDEYFESSGRAKRDCLRMYVKTAIILGWFAASYVGLVFFAAAWWQALALAVSLGLAAAAIGFCIQHDGGHQSYSRHGWVNRTMAMMLDFLGGSSFIWNRKHNSIHHTYSNIDGHDDDINLGALARLSPHQPRHWFHRFQHIYMWFLYGFTAIKWQLIDDFENLISGKIGQHKLHRPKGWDLVRFLFGKAVFVSLAFVIPTIVCGFLPTLLFYFVATFVLGVTLGVVFQLAHCVEEAEFPLPETGTGKIDNTWAVHQVATTVNFAPKSRILTWYTGGLNHQVEHHLFPGICHVNYPALSKIVRQTCEEFDIRYNSFETFAAGVASHYRWLRRMGTGEPAPQLAS